MLPEYRDRLTQRGLVQSSPHPSFKIWRNHSLDNMESRSWVECVSAAPPFHCSTASSSLRPGLRPKIDESFCFSTAVWGWKAKAKVFYLHATPPVCSFWGARWHEQFFGTRESQAVDVPHKRWNGRKMLVLSVYRDLSVLRFVGNLLVLASPEICQPCN